VTYIIGQEAHFNYTFDDCTFEDVESKFPGISPNGTPGCECGLGSKSMQLNGSSDHFTFSNQVNSLMDNDFTLDLYFLMDIRDGETDIFSHRNGCASLDSLMSLRYFSNTNELVFEIGSNVNNYFSIRQRLSPNICWHRFTLVKFGLLYFVYFDNVLEKSIVSRETISLSKSGLFRIANSPCNSQNQALKFKGFIDEIVMYKRALSDRELLNNYRFPDQIRTTNTTIFKGESIALEVGESCASNITWSPGNSLDNVNVLDPVATPSETTVYQVELNNNGCISKDTVTIFIADKDKLDCNTLLLPKAFTPNNDGLNERFGISNTFLVDDLEYFEVYDRSGAKVWETREKSEQWDGSKNGQPLNNGMYLYKIKYTCKGEEKLNINNFTLIR